MDTTDIKIIGGTVATGGSWVIANEFLTFAVGLSALVYTIQRIYLNYKYTNRQKKF